MSTHVEEQEEERQTVIPDVFRCSTCDAWVDTATVTFGVWLYGGRQISDSGYAAYTASKPKLGETVQRTCSSCKTVHTVTPILRRTPRTPHTSHTTDTMV